MKRAALVLLVACGGPTRPPPHNETVPAAPSPAPARHFHRDDGGLYHITHDDLSALADDPYGALRGARFDVDPSGWRIITVGDSVLPELGLHDGDVVGEINGFPLPSSDIAFIVLSKVREATGIEIEVRRGGVATMVRIHVD